MLHRKTGNTLLAISQPAHAWLSGELARHWGNRRFGQLVPREDLLLAAALHDIGFLSWEHSPTLTPQTKLPYTFLNLPTATHLAIWSAGIQQMPAYSRYAALLVSQHFTWLCRRHPSVSAADRRLEKRFLDQQEQFQTSLLDSLRVDPQFAPYTRNETLLRNRRLVSLWDWLSLLLCIGFRENQIVPDVPCPNGLTIIELKPLNSDSTRVAISPWPFREKALRLTCEGRRMERSYSDEKKMRAAMQTARSVTLTFNLAPA